ncbi:jacalin-related lectin 3-like [Cornus florida]|uniref:jacalin-related lectin 3-like n=1 Tax=Cornus florida TaxID=4283 RepID=UPI0028A2AF01|nr:jacalin-related lectin 3-like [Cornus florida]
MANEQTITCGPFGGPGTTATSWDDKTYTTVREVILHAGTEIHSIQLVYDNQGKPVYGQQHGSVGGTLYKVSLAYPGEYLVSISGHFGQCIYNNKKYVVLKSLIFHSNTKQHGPYGPQEGSRFLGPLPIGKIVGFFGKKGGRLDSIGVYVKPFPTRITVGPFGTTGGQQWDDGTYSTVREIIINAGALIDSIQVVYDSEGKPVMGEMHGSKSGNQHRVILDYPDEFLVSFSGYYGQNLIGSGTHWNIVQTPRNSRNGGQRIRKSPEVKQVFGCKILHPYLGAVCGNFDTKSPFLIPCIQHHSRMTTEPDTIQPQQQETMQKIREEMQAQLDVLRQVNEA